MKLALWLPILAGVAALPLRAATGPKAIQDREPTRAAGFRLTPLKVSTAGKAGLTRVSSSETGLAFTNFLSDALAESNRIVENGSGVAAGDIDGDGWCDLYFCRLEGPNVLYRNLGNWRFQDITAQAGVACAGQFSTGASWADLDGDGDLDLLVNSIGGGTRLFLNEGHAKFAESLSSGLVRQFGSTSMALADIEGDGDLDLYVANYRTTTVRDSPPDAKYKIRIVDGTMVVQPEDRFVLVGERQTAGIVEKGEADILYLNDGRGHFTPVSWTGGAFLDENGQALAAPPQGWGLSAMFRDLNGDGAPDLYVCNDFNFTADDVWLNDGHGRFRRIPKLALRTSSWSSMAVDFADINRDGWDDFIVVDMLSREHARRQTQRANPDLAVGEHPMGVIDERPQVMRNTLFLNRGDGTYAEIAQLSGVEASEWSWSVAFLDVDLDGFEDLLVTNGNLHDLLDADTATRNQALIRNSKGASPPKTLLNFPHLETRNLAFRNRGDLTFEEMGRAWGFDLLGVSHGMAFADLDNDGDLDVVINNLRADAGVFRNNSPAPRVAVRLRGQPPNTRGIGTKIRVTGGPVVQTQEMLCGGRYLSSDDSMRVFAIGSPTNRMRIEVLWSGGERSVVEEVQPNAVYEIEEPGGKDQGLKTRDHGRRTTDHGLQTSAQNTSSPDTPNGAETQPSQAISSNSVSRFPFRSRFHFEDVSDLLDHTHHEEPFRRFGPQPILPRRLTELGPGVSWFDLDGDGWEDLIVPSGKAGTLALFHNERGKNFRPVPAANAIGPAVGDQTTALGWALAAESRSLLIGVSNLEGGGTSQPSVLRFDFQRGRFVAAEPISGQTASVGPLALADIEGDGDLDLFVGGRVVPDQYPHPATSRLFRNEGGQFKLDLTNSRAFADAGLVSGAVFSDLDGDGFPELILACEWEPIRIFKNQHGTLKASNWPVVQTQPSTTAHGQRTTDDESLSTLSDFSGWWNGVAAGDFDGDGRMDIIASNWGRNTKYERHRRRPLRIYFGDFNGDGLTEVFEAYEDAALGKIVPWRDWASAALELPDLRKRFSAYRAYSVATVPEILGSQFSRASVLQANWLETTLFLNRGDRFEIRPLPLEAQFAPAFGIGVGDFDGDGAEDLFLSQNFFATEPDTSRHDGGRGLPLQGDGRGGFRAVPGQQSGLSVYGEQRGAALSDFDADGRVDLAVTQNGAATKLFRNVGAKPGLRIRLRGPPGNPTGIGATVRLRFGERFGPAREVHAGAGYWSQDGAALVMGGSEPPSAVWVRWPGGATMRGAVPKGASEIELDSTGYVTPVR